MSTLKVTNIQDTSGGNSSTSAEIYNGRAKAWIRFTNTGSIVDSYNVNSLGWTGDRTMTVNFSTSFANANYGTVHGMEATGSFGVVIVMNSRTTSAWTGTQYRFAGSTYQQSGNFGGTLAFYGD